MGRTRRSRRRRRRAGSAFRRLEHEPALGRLGAWLADRGCERNPKLGFAEWEGSGRGVVANRALCPGELLVDLPLSLTINLTTLLLDDDFCRLFLGCEPRRHRSLSLQALIAFYLVVLKARASGSRWHVYLQILPTEYTVPYFLSQEVKSHFEPNIQNIIAGQEEAVREAFDILNEILGMASDESTDRLRELLTLNQYEWAYFTVNTRCVYMDLSDIIDFESIENPLLLLLKDNATIALCPYLDMINHSSKVRTKTKLVVHETVDVRRQLKHIDEEILADIRFHLYTMDGVKSYEEVYICYGDSHNLKLVTEYGFFLPSNELDSVNFNFETIESYLASHNLKLSQEQCAFITNHSLNKGLYVDNSGLSFNFYALLTVLKLYKNQKSDISKIIYSDETGGSKSNLNSLIMPLVNDRIEYLEESIANINVDSISVGNCVNLMKRYVDILKLIQK